MSENISFIKDDIEELCNKIGISYSFLKYVLFVKKDKYSSFSIPKSNGETRTIEAPCRELKYIQRKIKEYIELNILVENPLPKTVKGFIKGESIVTNADDHYKSNYVLNIDLKDFFPSIHFGRVRGMFRKKPFNFNNYEATILAKVACYNGKLPQGSPLSPLIANCICYKLDYKIMNLCKKYHCIYTRYADDITVSTTRYSFPKEIAGKDDSGVFLGQELVDIISSNNFEINQSKTKLSYLNYRQEVTGLVVNERINIPKVLIKRIRAELNMYKKGLFFEGIKKNYDINTDDVDFAKMKCKQHIQGLLNYMKMVRGKKDILFLKYAKEFNEIFDVNFFDVSFLNTLEYVKERCYLIIDFNDSYNGTGFLTSKYGLITSTHNFVNNDTIPDYLDKIKNLKEDDNVYELYGLGFNYIQPNILKRYLPMIVKKENIKRDICNCKIDMRRKKFDINEDYEPKIGEEVIGFGYGNYHNEDNNSFKIINYKIVSRDEYCGIKFYALDIPLVKGMSGGPILNKDNEVIGIITFGTANSYDEMETQKINNGVNGFILLKDVKNVLREI